MVRPVSFYHLRVDSDICGCLASTWTSNAGPGLTSKAIFSQGDQRSEVRRGAVSRLPPRSPAPGAPYQGQGRGQGGRRPFKRRARRHGRSKASTDSCEHQRYRWLLYGCGHASLLVSKLWATNSKTSMGADEHPWNKQAAFLRVIDYS